MNRPAKLILGCILVVIGFGVFLEFVGGSPPTAPTHVSITSGPTPDGRFWLDAGNDAPDLQPRSIVAETGAPNGAWDASITGGEDATGADPTETEAMPQGENAALVDRLRKLRPRGVHADSIADAKAAVELAREKRLEDVARHEEEYRRMGSPERRESFIDLLSNLWAAIDAQSFGAETAALHSGASECLEALALVDGGLASSFRSIGLELGDRHLQVLLGSLGAHLAFATAEIQQFDHTTMQHGDIPEGVLLGYSGAWKLKIMDAGSFVRELVRTKANYSARDFKELRDFVAVYASKTSVQPPPPFLSLAEAGVRIPVRPSGLIAPEGVGAAYVSCSDLLRMNLWLLYGPSLQAALQSQGAPADLFGNGNSWALHGYAAACLVGSEVDYLVTRESFGASVGVWRTSYQANKKNSLARTVFAGAPSGAGSVAAPTRLAKIYAALSEKKGLSEIQLEDLDDWSFASVLAIHGFESVRSAHSGSAIPPDLVSRVEAIALGARRAPAVRAIEALSFFLGDEEFPAKDILSRASASSDSVVAANALLAAGGVISEWDESFRVRVEQLVSSNETSAILDLVQKINDPWFRSRRESTRVWLRGELSRLGEPWTELAGLLADD